MPVGDKPILEILIRRLRSYGLRDITISTGYLGSLLEAYFGDGSRWDVRITYSRETEPLGTAGPVSLIQGLEAPFFVMNGDLLTDIDFGAMMRFHLDGRSIGTVGLARKEVKIDLGVIHLNDQGRIKEYVEKPTLEYLVSMGIYVFAPEALKRIPKGKKFDLPDLVKALIAEGNAPVGFDSRCQWLDIGRPEDYALASEIFLTDENRFLGRAER
jgi:NDP-sugar pyrophosphorylase family protein